MNLLEALVAAIEEAQSKRAAFYVGDGNREAETFVHVATLHSISISDHTRLREFHDDYTGEWHGADRIGPVDIRWEIDGVFEGPAGRDWFTANLCNDPLEPVNIRLFHVSRGSATVIQARVFMADLMSHVPGATMPFSAVLQQQGEGVMVEL